MPLKSMDPLRPAALTAIALTAALLVSACGGGGGSAGNAVQTTPAPAVASSVSSGVITAFGSVFVNGHEFATANAKFIDDDSGTSSATAQGLEVGMVVDVQPAAGSTTAAPVASELHVHPLVRGYVDVLTPTSGMLTVMGQSVQLTSATNFSDHRACAMASPATCTPITGSSGLSATTGSGASTVAGSYVTVHGYLFGASSTATNVVATLIAVADAPATTAPGVNFKVEGPITVGSSVTSIGALTLDLTKAACYVAGVKTPCASAFSTGQIVSAWSAATPGLPATSFSVGIARQASKVITETSGAAIEVEGAVSAVTTSPAGFVVRGVTVNASALPAGTTLPAVGDIVRVVGTVAANGQSVAASSVTVLHAANSVKLGLQGDASGVAAGSGANTYTLSVLGQTVLVNAQTRLADMSQRHWDQKDPAANPFNINTFKTYLAASASQHVLLKAETDGSGVLVAQTLAIVPASSVAGVAGLVDSSPAVVNSSKTGTPSTFSVHGISISADPAAITKAHSMQGDNGNKGGGQSTALVTVVAGDQVVVAGTYANGSLSVGAKLSLGNGVMDAGAPQADNHDQGDF